MLGKDQRDMIEVRLSNIHNFSQGRVILKSCNFCLHRVTGDLLGYASTILQARWEASPDGIKERLGNATMNEACWRPSGKRLNLARGSPRTISHFTTQIFNTL
jgi:hypothetical protein